MCGICGMIQPEDNPVNIETLKRMNEAIHHRGPDSDGFYLNHNVGLAMRRLAIVDLVSGDQPIPNEDRTIWVILNGEIYNFPENRKKLEARGHTFRTNSDTESLVHLYEEYGAGFASHLRGMFAFALWDEKNHRLVIGRDRLGKKPLYYCQTNHQFLFCSELPGLLSGLAQKPGIIPQAMDDYLSLQYIPEPGTIFEGIFQIPPGYYATYENEKLNIVQYWQLDYRQKNTADETQLIEELREKLTEAVRIRLMSDVPLGAHLSGGLDSSIIVALMAQLSSTPVKTFSVGFEESSFSELPMARAVAKRYSTDHREFVLKFDNIPETMAKIVRHFGQPLADPSALPLYLLSLLTKEYVTVALNGDGGDESMAGYARYAMDPLANMYMQLPGFINRGLIPSLSDGLSAPANRPIGTTWQDGIKRLANLMDVNPRASILRWGSYFSPQTKRSLWKEPYRSELQGLHAEKFLVNLFQGEFAGNTLDRTLYEDVNSYLPGDLLVKADRMTMAASLEGRSPLLDHEYFEWAARLPVKYKLHGRQGKYLLRKAFNHLLPEENRNYRKQGFSLPVGAWFKGPLAEWARGTLLGSDSKLNEWFEGKAIERILTEHSGGKIDHGKRIWALMVLELWLQQTG
jgi:asparagine synthase (glutamine-hydrolysing)